MANFEEVITYWEESYRKHKFSKQNLVSHLIFQLLKFVLQYV